MNLQPNNCDNSQKSILAKTSVVISFIGLVLFVFFLLFSFLSKRIFLQLAILSGFCAMFCSVLGTFFGISASIAIFIKKNLKGGYLAILGVVVGIILYLLTTNIFFPWFEKMRGNPDIRTHAYLYIQPK